MTYLILNFWGMVSTVNQHSVEERIDYALDEGRPNESRLKRAVADLPFNPHKWKILPEGIIGSHKTTSLEMAMLRTD